MGMIRANRCHSDLRKDQLRRVGLPDAAVLCGDKALAKLAVMFPSLIVRGMPSRFTRRGTWPRDFSRILAQRTAGS